MRRSLIRSTMALALTALTFAPAALAQSGRVGGLVRTESGEPIKGATITAESDEFGTSMTATTDDRGRFTMIGLRGGEWRFAVEAPGFFPRMIEAPVRMGGAPNPPMAFALRRTGPGVSAALGNVSAQTLQEQLRQAEELFEQENWDAAIASYESILARTPALSSIRLQIGAAHRMRGDHQAAVAAYEGLLSAEPDNEQALVGLAMAHFERGDTESAEQLLLNAVERSAAGRETFFALGEIRARQGAADDAAAWFERAARADASWGKPLFRLGELALEQGDEDAAAQYLSRVLAVAPASLEAEAAESVLSRLSR